MECLTDKSYRQYDNLSRYATVPYYYHEIDGKYTVGLTSRLKTDSTYVTHIIKQGDTLDSLALKYYNAPTFYWVIAEFNRINDPFMKLPVGYTLYIPTLSAIEFGE